MTMTDEQPVARTGRSGAFFMPEHPFSSLRQEHHSKDCGCRCPGQKNSGSQVLCPWHRGPKSPEQGSCRAVGDSARPEKDGRCDRVAVRRQRKKDGNELPGLRDKSQGPRQHPPLASRTRREARIRNERIVGITLGRNNSLVCRSTIYKSDPARGDRRSLEDSDLSPLAK